VLSGRRKLSSLVAHARLGRSVRFMNLKAIVTHPGGAHKDDFLACSLLISRFGVPVYRREPSQEDIDDVQIAVVDVGGEHDPARMNFDHHQFPREHEPLCAISLVLEFLEIYKDTKDFCDWLETAEWMDTRGPMDTAKWLDIEREAMAKLNSPIDITLIRRFAQVTEHLPAQPIYEVMRMIGDDLIFFVTTMRKKMDALDQCIEFWEIKGAGGKLAAFVPRTKEAVDDPSSGMARYVLQKGMEEDVIALIYPDRRGDGYGLARMSDCNHMEYTRVVDEPDVHFAHNRGFIAKTCATEKSRLAELLEQAYVADLNN